MELKTMELIPSTYSIKEPLFIKVCEDNIQEVMDILKQEDIPDIEMTGDCFHLTEVILVSENNKKSKHISGIWDIKIYDDFIDLVGKDCVRFRNDKKLDTVIYEKNEEIRKDKDILSPFDTINERYRAFTKCRIGTKEAYKLMILNSVMDISQSLKELVNNNRRDPDDVFLNDSDVMMSSKVIDGYTVPIEKKCFSVLNTIEAEVGTNGYQGGDSGHGSRTYISLTDLSGTDMRINIINDRSIELTFGGDSELTTIIDALYFIIATLKKRAIKRE